MRFPKSLNAYFVAMFLGVSSSGCGLVAGTAARATNVVATTGYAVYQGGALVVESTGNLVKAGVEGTQEVVYSGGHFKTTCHEDLELVYNASFTTFHEMRFLSIQGKQDALWGKLEANTAQNEKVVLELKMLEKNETEFSLKIGKKGDMKSSQLVYDNILSLLGQQKKQNKG